MDKETEDRLQWIMWDIANTWEATEDELKLLFWSNNTPWPPVAPHEAVRSIPSNAATALD